MRLIFGLLPKDGDMLANRIFSALAELRFSNGSVFREAGITANRVVRQMWVEHELPCQRGKQWLVGYNIRHSFFGTSATPIYVGPKKPSHFRDRYVSVKVDRQIRI